MSLRDITRAVASNNILAGSSDDRLRSQLNNAVRNPQTINLEEQLFEFNQQFEGAARGHILQEIDHGMQFLNQDGFKIATVQDPPQMCGRRRTFGQRGPRQLTQAEIAEKQIWHPSYDHEPSFGDHDRAEALLASLGIVNSRASNS
jgi:hypothetical protein